MAPAGSLTIGACILTAGLAVSSRPQAAAAPPHAADGMALFTKVWSAAQGLGPLANAQSCAACHASPSLGGTSADKDAFVLLSAEETDDTGGHLFRQLLIRPGRAVVRRPLPRRVVTRRPPALFGLGQLQHIPAAALVAAEDPDDRDGDGISGRRGAGRFGWKARFATIRDAVAGALTAELGLTNGIFATAGSTPEIGDADLDALATFVASLPPLRPRALPREGVELFARTGCAGCHRSPVGGVVEPYTDLLLHDMGALGDGLTDGGAGPREVRTTPLWGVARLGPPFLHDGRASTIDAAIRAHDGEAAAARSRYLRLGPEQKRTLLEFLHRL